MGVPISRIRPFGTSKIVFLGEFRIELDADRKFCLIIFYRLAAGFTVALINYPGSAGFGQATISDLSKDCGILDVQACLEMKRYLVKLGIASPAKGKSFFLGHSHSGFIGAHLSVRYPDDFDAISLCNPVIDLVSNFATSDIPAW